MGHAARRNPSTSHNQPFSWFQLAKFRVPFPFPWRACQVFGFASCDDRFRYRAK